jgi:hypothetical protein
VRSPRSAQKELRTKWRLAGYHIEETGESLIIRWPRRQAVPGTILSITGIAAAMTVIAAIPPVFILDKQTGDRIILAVLLAIGTAAGLFGAWWLLLCLRHIILGRTFTFNRSTHTVAFSEGGFRNFDDITELGLLFDEPGPHLGNLCLVLVFGDTGIGLACTSAGNCSALRPFAEYLAGYVGRELITLERPDASGKIRSFRLESEPNFVIAKRH